MCCRAFAPALAADAAGEGQGAAKAGGCWSMALCPDRSAADAASAARGVLTEGSRGYPPPPPEPGHHCAAVTALFGTCMLLVSFCTCALYLLLRLLLVTHCSLPKRQLLGSQLPWQFLRCLRHPWGGWHSLPQSSAGFHSLHSTHASSSRYDPLGHFDFDAAVVCCVVALVLSLPALLGEAVVLVAGLDTPAVVCALVLAAAEGAVWASCPVLVPERAVLACLNACTLD